MNTKITDEMLMAYADGQLEDDQVYEVEAFLAIDERGRQLVAEFKKTAELAAEAFAAPIDEAPPQDLVDMIRNHAAQKQEETRPAEQDQTAAEPESAEVIAFPFRRRIQQYSLPIAASIALVIGGVIGMQLAGKDGNSDTSQLVALGPVAPDTPLSHLLTRSPSGSYIQQRPGRSLTVVATFKDKGNRYCREFEYLTGQTESDLEPEAAAIACRDSKRGWVVEGAAHVAKAQTGEPGYLPSGAAEQDALDGLVNMLGLGKALAPDQEAKLVGTGWKNQ